MEGYSGGTMAEVGNETGDAPFGGATYVGCIYAVAPSRTDDVHVGSGLFLYYRGDDGVDRVFRDLRRNENLVDPLEVPLA